MEPLYTQLLDAYRNKPYENYLTDRDAIASRLAKLPKTKSSFKYDDYVPFPEYDNEDFNKIIVSKKEFIRNRMPSVARSDFDKVSSERCSMTNFSLTPNQRFIKGFLSPLTPYNGLLLFHGVGVGKTCTAITIAEQYHDIYKKKILVILSSNLIDNFKKQIFDATKYDLKTNTANLCTGTKYSDMVVDKKKLSAEELQKKVNKIINDKYQFIGYKELAIYMDKIEKGVKENNLDQGRIHAKYMERLSETFSNRLIIIDEAHNLRSSSETGKKHTSIAFKKLLENVVNVKLVLLTATPMFNNAKEIVWTLNLLLTNDKRPEIKASIFDEEGNLTPDGRSTLIRSARGYVSYLRGENPFTFPFRLYPSINHDKNLLKGYPTKDINGHKISQNSHIKHMEIVVSPMSQYQRSVYNVFKKPGVVERTADDEDEEEVDEDNPSNDLQNTLQVSNIVYPPRGTSDVFDKDSVHNLYGTTGLLSCMQKNDKGGKYSYRQNYPEFLRYDQIDKYSPKIKKVVDYIIKSKGIVFVYSQYYSAGIIPLAIALEHIGFSKYQGSGSGKGNIAKDITVDDKFGGKKPQYIIVSRSQDLSPNNDAEITASKLAANKDGDIIKVIIVSKIGTEGIDFKRIREVHILEPWFNLNRSEQIIGRAVRYCSHIDLPKSQRNVTIYFHACTYDDENESVDLRTYRMAENKQTKIIAVEKVLKETSIDCNLNKRSLAFPVDKLNIAFDIETSQGTMVKDYKIGDRDNSYTCGLGKCKAVCDPNIISVDDPPDASTFDKSFITDDISMYMRFIGDLYRSKKMRHMSFKTILSKMKKEYVSIEDEILIYALSEMVTHKYLIEDDLGRSGYLLYRGDQYIFQPNRLVDTRMTLEERDNEQYFKSHLSLKNIENLKDDDDDKAKDPPVDIEVDIKSPSGIFDFIEETLTAKMALLESFAGKTLVSKKEIKMSVIDSIIDSLTRDQYTNLLNILAKIYNEDQRSMSELSIWILKSLKDHGVLAMNKDKKIQYAYNHFEAKIQCFRDTKFADCYATDSLGNKAFFEGIKEKSQEGLRKETKSYVAINNNATEYKIRTIERFNGYVCHNTSTLTVNKLKSNIDELLSNAGVAIGESPEKERDSKKKKKSFPKADLCWFFEIFSRVYTPEVFQRPFFIKIETKKLKKKDAK
jgi:hypothetical protein